MNLLIVAIATNRMVRIVTIFDTRVKVSMKSISSCCVFTPTYPQELFFLEVVESIPKHHFFSKASISFFMAVCHLGSDIALENRVGSETADIDAKISYVD